MVAVFFILWVGPAILFVILGGRDMTRIQLYVMMHLLLSIALGFAGAWLFTTVFGEGAFPGTTGLVIGMLIPAWYLLWRFIGD